MERLDVSLNLASRLWVSLDVSVLWPNLCVGNVHQNVSVQTKKMNKFHAGYDREFHVEEKTQYWIRNDLSSTPLDLALYKTVILFRISQRQLSSPDFQPWHLSDV